MAKKQYGLTFDDVKKLFQEKGVELLSEEHEWENKKIYMRDTFLMKAKICNHKKTICLKNFKKDKGLNYCQGSCYLEYHRTDYNKIFELFEKKGATLLVKEQEFKQNLMTGTSVLNFVGNCGHECKTSYINFLTYDYVDKKNCLKCTRKNQNQNSNLIKNKIKFQFVQEICTKQNIQYVDTIYKKNSKSIQYVLKCQHNHEFKRTINELNMGQSCSICTFDPKQNNKQISIGDYHEQQVFDIMKKHCKSIEIVGNTACLYDIIYTLDDNIKRGLQVKSLSKDKYKDNVFNSNIRKKNTQQDYQKNVIFILINQQDQRFVIDMSQNFTTNMVTIYFDSKKCKYQNTKFTDQNLFAQRLVSLLPQNSEIDVFRMYSSNMQKEFNCFERLQKKCIELGLSFQRNTTNGNSTDAYINSKPVQIKYCESNHRYNTVAFNLRKSGGMKNGKRTIIPYNYKDEVQFFIFEYGGENGKFLSNFCILSKEFLIQQKYISTTDSKGKTTIHIQKLDSELGKDKIGRNTTRNAPTLEFWNKFDQLQ